jgi:hypothetical protein
MIGDLPSMQSASHTHTIYGLSNLTEPLGIVQATNPALLYSDAGLLPAWNPGRQAAAQGQFASPPGAMIQTQPKPQKPKEMPVSRRLVQVFIADPDENVPLESSMLYSGEQKLTDATDQELFFEIDMKAILQSHNATRVTVVNKKVKERTEYLEPAKIRDLKMVVVNVATF